MREKDKTMPTVSLHKSGRFVRLKANDTYAADVVREISSRICVPYMRKAEFYDIKGSAEIPKDEHKVEIWRWLENGIETHPIVGILASYGVQTQYALSLKNYIAKEAKRQELENTPYPTPAVNSEVTLFERCSEGTVLLCIKDFGKNASGKPVFAKGKRYMVLNAGGEGSDNVVISTNEIASGLSINLTGNAAKYTWTMFSEPMDIYFSDSESIDLGKNLVQKYPELVKQSKSRLKTMGLALYDHVIEDASMMALKRGVMNAYPMRMGKTSCAIAVAELTGSQKIAAIAPGNARLFWTKEFERLGFKEGKDFVEVRSLNDLDTPAKYHLMTYTWLSLGKDPAYKARKNWENLLKPSVRTIKRQRAGITWKEIEEIDIDLTNDCPHCKKPLERPQRLPGGALDINPKGKVIWTAKRGYICRNSACKWKTDNRESEAASWSAKKLINHVGGYIDYELAKHADCEDVRVKGRMCPECHTVDASWVPPKYKRIKKKYTHVILDEAHATKDPSTNTSTAALNLRARRRQTLTGTPMSNSAMDIYYPLHWSMSAPTTGFPYFATEGFKTFDNRFCDALTLEKPVGNEIDANGKVTQLTKTVRKRVPFLKNPPDFWRFIAPKLVRRSYSDPLFIKTLTANGRMMPKVDIKKIPCPMDAQQAALMLASIKDFRGTFEKLQKEATKKGTQVNPTLVISQMTTMRTAATCPEFLNKRFGTKIYNGPDGGGKIPYIKGVVEEKLDQGGKVLILSDFLQMQETVDKALKHLGTIRFNTQWDDEVRREAFDKFQDDEKAKVFIAGTRAIREGVDLSAADTVICCDLLWSPAFQTQAWSRIMAPSIRERTCEVYLTLSANSLDEHIFNVFYSKMVAAEQALDRKVLNRRAQEIDIRWFVERVLEEEMALNNYLRDAGEETMLIADLDLSQFEARGE
jgi:hypothetical protein